MFTEPSQPPAVPRRTANLKNLAPQTFISVQLTDNVVEEVIVRLAIKPRIPTTYRKLGEVLSARTQEARGGVEATASGLKISEVEVKISKVQILFW